MCYQATEMYLRGTIKKIFLTVKSFLTTNNIYAQTSGSPRLGDVVDLKGLLIRRGCVFVHVSNRFCRSLRTMQKQYMNVLTVEQVNSLGLMKMRVDKS